eukprot:gene7214-7980_t
MDAEVVEGEEEGGRAEESLSPAKPSYLPSWVIRMRSKIEASRREHSLTEDRLSQLCEGVTNLEEKLRRASLTSSATPTTSTSTDTTTSTTVTTTSTTANPPSPPPVRSRSFFFLPALPDDCLGLLMVFLGVKGCLQLCCASRLWRSAVISVPFWMDCYREHFSFLNLQTHNSITCGSSGSLRYEEVYRAIAAYLQDAQRSLTFLQALKEQRCLPRHNQTSPRRYSRSETSVTHPLLFNASNDLVMSRAETLNSDFRALTHRTLQIIMRLTSLLIDNFCDRLVREGIVTVLLALLANEEAMVQNYACHILANLLYWEAQRGQGMTSATVAALLRSLNGPRQLSSLLTSPSACIHLGGGRASATVQGVCCKQASRALISLYYPHTSVSDQQDSGRDAGGKKKEEEVLQEIYELTYFHKSGLLRDSSQVQLCWMDAGRRVAGQGEDSVGAFSLRGQRERDIADDVLIFHKTYRQDSQPTRSASSVAHAHVSHLAFFAAKASDGLWGVWETNSGQTHFDLQKGGVFRITPIY